MWYELILEGVKKFAGEIIGLILITIFFALFPGLRNLFNRYKPKKDDDITDIQDAIRELEAKRKEESERRAEIERQLESERQEKERIQEEARRKEEALRQVEAQRIEEARRREGIERQLEAQRKEQERIQSEIQRKEKLSQEEARKLEDTLRQSEVKKQRTPISDEEFIGLCESGATSEVEEAISNGANVNAKNNSGNTALTLATKRGHPETAELLRRYGAE